MKIIRFGLIAGLLGVSSVVTADERRSAGDQFRGSPDHPPLYALRKQGRDPDLQYYLPNAHWRQREPRNKHRSRDSQLPVLGQLVAGPGGAGWRRLLYSLPRRSQLNRAGARSLFNANLATGYYFIPHDFTPIGDMVWYLSTNLNQPIDDRGPSRTLVTLTPGFRTHVGRNCYLLGAVEVPETSPEPFDYQVLGGIMKVF
jgi:hypothetical protein